MTDFIASYAITFGTIAEVDSPDLQHWQLSDPETLKAVGALEKRGVKRLKWKGHPGCCENCLKNDGKTVQVGKPFPSGAITVPEHNRCICEIIPLKE